jgi:hypothetical protein
VIRGSNPRGGTAGETTLPATLQLFGELPIGIEIAVEVDGDVVFLSLANGDGDFVLIDRADLEAALGLSVTPATAR